jgi:hypothetical protein
LQGIADRCALPAEISFDDGRLSLDAPLELISQTPSHFDAHDPGQYEDRSQSGG